MNYSLAFPATPPPFFRLAFMSSCLGEWGGSEELWAGTALHLAKAGHSVKVFKTNLNPRTPRLAVLRAAGATLTELDPRPPLLRRVLNRLLPYRPRPQVSQRILRRHLQAFRPDLVLISQGTNYDGIFLAEVCHQLGLTYTLLAQKATNSSLPEGSARGLTQQLYRGARRSYFVSRHNLLLTQLQLGQHLPAAEVVWNPSTIASLGELPWPAPRAGRLQLACVARLFLSDKGQDILLQVLAQPRWRARPVHLTLYGEGPDKEAIAGMITFLGLQAQVSLAGHVADISQIWHTHHALVLPSRYEGLPLSLIEAALAGRPAIATDAGGIGELLQDGETGFLATANTFQALDVALERAWVRRADWPSLGAEAARQARATVPADAAAELGQKLLRLLHPPQLLPPLPTAAPAYALLTKPPAPGSGPPAKKAAQTTARAPLVPAALPLAGG